MIADRYAAALFQAAQGAGPDALATIDSQAAEVTALLQDNDQLRQLWMHPVVSAADHKDLVAKLLGGKVHPLLLNTIKLLFDKKRGALYTQVQSSFRSRFDALRRRATVKVTSALPMEAAQANQLQATLATRLAREVVVETAVDPDLLGGVVLQIDDMVVDHSLRGRLDALKASLN